MWETIGKKTSRILAKSVRSGITIWWCDVTLSEAGWVFSKLRGGEKRYGKGGWSRAGTWAWSELFLRIQTSHTDIPAGRMAINIWGADRNSAQTCSCFSLPYLYIYSQLTFWIITLIYMHRTQSESSFCWTMGSQSVFMLTWNSPVRNYGWNRYASPCKGASAGLLVRYT